MRYKDIPQTVYFIYILLCKDDSYYVGLTNDLVRRVDEHRNGAYPHCYTFKRRPLTLLYYETCPFLEDAIEREKQLKGWSKVKKKALIAQNYHMLQLFAQCQNMSHKKYADVLEGGKMLCGGKFG